MGRPPILGQAMHEVEQRPAQMHVGFVLSILRESPRLFYAEDLPSITLFLVRLLLEQYANA